MPRKATKPSSRQKRVDNLCSYASDCDVALSSMQRLHVGDELQNRIREIRVQVTQVVAELLDQLDPDLSCSIDTSLISSLPMDVEDADDGRHQVP